MNDRPATKKAASKKTAAKPEEPPVAPPAEPDTEGHPLGPGYPRRVVAVGDDGPWYAEEGSVTIEDALAAMQAEMPVVAKSKTAQIEGRQGGRGYSYDYADLADIVAALKPLFAKYGFSFTCHPRRVGDAYELEGVLRYAPSGENITGALPIPGRTPQDLGSAITYARRYLLGCLTGIITDDDDDGAMATAAEPTTEQLLVRLDAVAKGQNTDREQITAKWREQHGGIPVEVLPMLHPMSLRPLVESIEAWVSAQAAQTRQ